MRWPADIPGQEADAEYLLDHDATTLQALAWLATHPRGNSSPIDMDDYLKGSNW